MTHIKLQVFLLVILIGSNFTIIRLVLRNILELRHALLWLFMGFVLILFTLFPEIWVLLADYFSIVEPVNMLFLFAILILFFFVFHLIIENSKQSKRNMSIAQELALLKQRVDKLQKQLDEVKLP